MAAKTSRKMKTTENKTSRIPAKHAAAAIAAWITLFGGPVNGKKS